MAFWSLFSKSTTVQQKVVTVDDLLKPHAVVMSNNGKGQLTLQLSDQNAPMSVVPKPSFPTLEEILQVEDIAVEIKLKNELLMQFICIPENLSKLIDKTFSPSTDVCANAFPRSPGYRPSSPAQPPSPHRPSSTSESDSNSLIPSVESFEVTPFADHLSTSVISNGSIVQIDVDEDDSSQVTTSHSESQLVDSGAFASTTIVSEEHCEPSNNNVLLSCDSSTIPSDKAEGSDGNGEPDAPEINNELYFEMLSVDHPSVLSRLVHDFVPEIVNVLAINERLNIVQTSRFCRMTINLLNYNANCFCCNLAASDFTKAFEKHLTNASLCDCLAKTRFTMVISQKFALDLAETIQKNWHHSKNACRLFHTQELFLRCVRLLSMSFKNYPANLIIDAIFPLDSQCSSDIDDNGGVVQVGTEPVASPQYKFPLFVKESCLIALICVCDFHLPWPYFGVNQHTVAKQPWVVDSSSDVCEQRKKDDIQLIQMIISMLLEPRNEYSIYKDIENSDNQRDLEYLQYLWVCLLMRLVVLFKQMLKRTNEPLVQDLSSSLVTALNFIRKLITTYIVPGYFVRYHNNNRLLNAVARLSSLAVLVDLFSDEERDKCSVECLKRWFKWNDSPLSQYNWDQWYKLIDTLSDNLPRLETPVNCADCNDLWKSNNHQGECCSDNLTNDQRSPVTAQHLRSAFYEKKKQMNASRQMYLNIGREVKNQYLKKICYNETYSSDTLSFPPLLSPNGWYYEDPDKSLMESEEIAKQSELDVNRPFVLEDINDDDKHHNTHITCENEISLEDPRNPFHNLWWCSMEEMFSDKGGGCRSSSKTTNYDPIPSDNSDDDLYEQFMGATATQPPDSSANENDSNSDSVENQFCSGED